jgi:hypothetical protein
MQPTNGKQKYFSRLSQLVVLPKDLFNILRTYDP